MVKLALLILKYAVLLWCSTVVAGVMWVMPYAFERGLSGVVWNLSNYGACALIAIVLLTKPKK